MTTLSNRRRWRDRTHYVKRPQAVYLSEIERDEPRRRRTDEPLDREQITRSRLALLVLAVVVVVEVVLAVWWV